MRSYQKEFTKFIKLLNDNDLLQYVLVVGSWAEFIYEESGVIEDFEPNIRTLDMDILIKNLRKPNPPVSILSIANEENYRIDTDRLNGTNKILDKRGFEIEFLIAKKGAGREPALKTNLGVTAQTLNHMGVLLNNTIECDYLGMKVIVPTPEAYTIHKMIINSERKYKAEKDLISVKYLWNFLDRNKFEDIRETLTKKERNRVEVILQQLEKMEENNELVKEAAYNDYYKSEIEF